MANNVWSDVSAIAQRIESDAIFVVRETNFLEPLVTVFRDMSGMNLRRGYVYNQASAVTISDADDLTSASFAPSADQTLTPYEIGLQFFITDARAESELPENIMADAARELGFAAADKIMTDMVGDYTGMTGGTVGAAGSSITWSYVGAGIAQARDANKSASKPLAYVLHGNQWAVLAKAANIAGASVSMVAPNFQEDLTVRGGAASYCTTYMGVPIYQVFQDYDADIDFNGAIFPREALAIDWRRPVRVEAERNASRRGWELNMSAIYDTGIWRPDRGISMLFDAAKPTA